MNQSERYIWMAWHFVFSLGGEGVRVVYDGVGKDTITASLKSLAVGGYLVAFGNASGKVLVHT